jgi:hypothetical protein
VKLGLFGQRTASPASAQLGPGRLSRWGRLVLAGTLAPFGRRSMERNATPKAKERHLVASAGLKYTYAP